MKKTKRTKARTTKTRTAKRATKRRQGGRAAPDPILTSSNPRVAAALKAAATRRRNAALAAKGKAAKPAKGKAAKVKTTPVHAKPPAPATEPEDPSRG